MSRHALSRRRTTYLAKTVAVGAVLSFVLAVLVPATGAQASALNIDEEPALAEFDIRAVAEEFGVSFEAAKSRLEFEARFIELVTQVAEGVPSYVDSAFDGDFANASGRVLLANASNSEWETAEAILAPLGNAVQIEPARLTEADEEAMLDTVRNRLAWLENEGHVIVLGWSATSDRLTVVVGGPPGPPTGSDRERIESAVDDLATNVQVLDGPESFDEGHSGTCSSDPTQTGGWTEGGRRINPCGAIANHNCTSGFSVRSVTTPSRTGVLTAAHCNDFSNNVNKWWYIPYADGESPFSTVRYFDHMAYNLGDIVFVREWFASALARPRVYRYDQIWTTITTFQNENPEGTTIIAKGAQTAYEENDHQWANMVGTIRNNTVSTTTNGVSPITNHQYADANYGNGTCCTTQLSPRPGDSGSPVWVVATGRALGIHKGGNPGFEIYSKIGYALTDMNLQMLKDSPRN